MTAILTKDPFDLPDPIPLPQPLGRIISHCLEKKPEVRFQSARDVLFALETFASLPGPASVAGRTRRKVSALVAFFALGVLALGGAAGFVVARRIAGPPAAKPVFHQLTSRRGFVFSARFTPDGQSVVYGAAWDGRPVELFTTRASGAESIALPIPSADVLSVSPTGELAVSLGRRYFNGWTSSGTLARGTSGTAPRKIVEGVQDADWSPRQGDLVITRRVGQQHRLEWPISRTLHSTAGWFSCPRVSPKGDLVAFFEHPVHGDDRGAVAVSDQHGSKRVLSDGWASLSGLAWSPAGDEVWFTGSLSSTTRELHGVDMSGKVRSLLPVPGSVTLYDVARDGRVLLARESIRSVVAGLAPGDRSERDLSWTDGSYGHDLSSDGRMVLLSEQGVGASGLYDVYLRRTDGSAPTHLGEGLSMALSPDGKWALTLVLKSPPELLLLPTGAGSARHLARGRIQAYAYAASWFPSGKRVLFQGSEAGGQNRLYVQSVDGGEPAAITPEGVHLAGFADPISPNGQTVAALGVDERVWLYPVSGGAPTIVPMLAPGETPLIWSRDGQSLFVLQWQDAAHVRIHKVDLRIQRKTLVRDIAPPIPGLMSILHLQAADEVEAYVYTYMQRLSDLYVVNGIR